MNPSKRRLAQSAPATAGPTNLYEILRTANSSPQWLASALRLDLGIVLNWCWGLDLPPEPVRAQVEQLLAREGLDVGALWLPLDRSQLKPLLRLVPPQEDSPAGEEASTPDKEDVMEVVSREVLTQAELKRFGIPENALLGECADPFDEPEDPTNTFRSPQLQACEAVLWEAVRKKQILVFVGDPGAGKSTLIRRAYGNARREKQMRFLSCARLNRAKLTHDTLTVAILRDLVGRDTSGLAAEQRDELLRSTLAELRGVFPVLLLDEAHHLSNQALLAIKHIWDSHTMFRQLAVVLVGHKSLAERLAGDAAVRELTMRARIIELPAFDGPTCQAYLEWRFKRVGAPQPFTPAACEVLARRGRYPLMVNNLAIRAMRAAAPTGRVVEAEHVGRA